MYFAKSIDHTSMKSTYFSEKQHSKKSIGPDHYRIALRIALHVH